jgi:tRNA(fMet)-specific endonuclease VapC
MGQRFDRRRTILYPPPSHGNTLRSSRCGIGWRVLPAGWIRTLRTLSPSNRRNRIARPWTTLGDDLLDGNAVVVLLRGDAGFSARLRRHRPEDVAISAIVAHEFYSGAYKGRRSAENLARVEALRFDVVEFDREDARQAGRIRAALAAAGTPIGRYDVLIAGQAAARGLTLITRNTREFHRVEALRTEDWEA